MTAKICYVEIPAPDLEKATAFYRSVFGWAVERSDLSDQPYSMFRAGEGGLAGGLDPTKSVAKGGIIFYVEVEDIPATLRIARAEGGSVAVEKRPIGGDYGYSAILEDPGGNRIGLWSRT